MYGCPCFGKKIKICSSRKQRAGEERNDLRGRSLRTHLPHKAPPSSRPGRIQRGELVGGTCELKEGAARGGRRGEGVSHKRDTCEAGGERSGRCDGDAQNKVKPESYFWIFPKRKTRGGLPELVHPRGGREERIRAPGVATSEWGCATLVRTSLA